MLRLVRSTTRHISPNIGDVETGDGDGTPASWPSGPSLAGPVCGGVRSGAALLEKEGSCDGDASLSLSPSPSSPLRGLSWLSSLALLVCGTAKVSRCLSDAVRSVVICGEQPGA
jgi:hypothetical protein